MAEHLQQLQDRIKAAQIRESLAVSAAPVAPSVPDLIARIDVARSQRQPTPRITHPLARVSRRAREDREAREPVVPGIPPPIFNMGGPGRARSAGRAVVQGAADVLASVPEALAISRTAGNPAAQNLFDRVEAGEEVDLGDAQAPELASDLLIFRNFPQRRQALREKYAVTDPRETGLFKAGVALREKAQETFPINPQFRGEFLADLLPRGIGSTAGFVIAGLGTRGLGLRPLLGAAALGAAAQAPNQFRDALANNASIEDAFEAAKLAAVVGTSEALPIARLITRLDKNIGGSIRKALKEGLKGGVEEGLQELTQQIGDNLIAAKLVKYDQERGFFQGTKEGGSVGFTVGFLFNTIAAMLGVKPVGTPPRQFTARTIRTVGTTARPAATPGKAGEPFVRPATEAPPAAEPALQAAPIEGIVVAEPAATEPAVSEPSPEDLSQAADTAATILESGSLDETLNLIRKGVRRPRVQSLTQFLVNAGGLKEFQGELKGLGIAGRARPGLLNNKNGLTFDDAGLRAFEQGFFKERPTVAEFLTALGNDFDKTSPRFRDQDADAMTEFGILSEGVATAERDLDLIGIDLGTLTNEQIRERLAEVAATVPDIEEGVAAPITEEERLQALRAESAAAGLPEIAFAGTQGLVAPGENFVGAVADEVEGVRPDTVLRRENILRPLLAALNVPLFQGRIKSRKILGFYRRHIEEVRVKRMNDIEVASHELAHMLDDRVPEIRAQWSPASNDNKAKREELRGVSYDKKKLFEGFAEFVRLWATQKIRAQAAAPVFYDWFEGFLDRYENGPAFRKAQDDMHAWFAQDAVTRARSKIGETEEINAGLTRPWEGFRQSVSDDLHGIMRMELQLTGQLRPGGAYETARLTRSKQTIIEGALLYGAIVSNPDGSHRFEGKGLQQVLDPVADSLDDFLMYAVGRSAAELKEQGRERLFTTAEIEGMQALETPAFRLAFDEYQDWNSAIVDFAVAKGAINPDQRKMWRRTQYLPFHRVNQPGAGTGSATPGEWKGVKALTGGTGNLRDILGNMIGNAAMLINVALTNEARLKAASLAKKRGGAHFMAEIAREDRTVRISQQEIERAILDALDVGTIKALPPEQQSFLDDIMVNMAPMVPLVMRGQSPFGQNVVAALSDGVPIFFEVADPLLYRSLISFNRPARNWLTRFLGGFRRIGQTSITLSFDFMAANIARDTLMGWVMSNHGFRPMVDSAIGMGSRISADENYREFIANGGGFSSYLVDENAFKSHIEKFYSQRGINFQSVLHSPAKLLFGIERIADAFEMSTRLGEFKRAREGGADPRHAAYLAREVSTDFAMRGDSTVLGFFYDTVIFLKAAVNGMDRLYRGLAQDPNRAKIAAKTALLAVLSMGLYAINRGNPLYDDLEDWDKDTAWHFFIPTAETILAFQNGLELPPLEKRYLHFRYPKIWEIGSIGSLAERSLERFLDEQPARLADDTLRILRNTFRFEYVPQAFSPLYELAINRIRFIDRPIESPTLRELQPFARSAPGGSRAIRKLGELTRDLPPEFQASPAQVEALLRGYLNTWALYGLTLADAALFDDTPSLRVDQYPVIRRFFPGQPSRNIRQLTEFYDALAVATEARRTMKFLSRTFRPDIAKEVAFGKANLEYKQLTRANDRMRSIGAEMRLVLAVPDLVTLQRHAVQLGRISSLSDGITRIRRGEAWGDLGDLKRELLDMWTVERNSLAKRVMTDIEERRGQPRKP